MPKIRTKGAISVNIRGAVERVDAEDETGIGTALHNRGLFHFLGDDLSHQSGTSKGAQDNIVRDNVELLLVVAGSILFSGQAEGLVERRAAYLAGDKFGGKRHLRHKMAEIGAQLRTFSFGDLADTELTRLPWWSYSHRYDTGR